MTHYPRSIVSPRRNFLKQAASLSCLGAFSQCFPDVLAENSDAAASAPPWRTIYPWPQSVNWGKGMLRFSGQVTLFSGDGSDQKKIETIVDLWNRFTFGKIALNRKVDPKLRANEIVFASDSSLPAIPSIELDPKGKGSYSLDVTAQGAAIRANDGIGLLHGYYTFLQLVEPLDEVDGTLSFSLPCTKIHDSCDLAFRGLHLCIFPESPRHMIERAVRLAAFFKFTHVVLEFWGTLKLDALAELSWPDAWTKEEAEKIVEIARSMGLEVIPMFNSWGHATESRVKYGRHVVLDQNPSLAPLFEPDGWTWCLSNPRSLDLLQSVHDELIEFAGPGQYFHIGCDEAYSHATCDRCYPKDRVKLLADHVNRLAAHLEKRGRRPLMWGDALLERGKWPKGFAANGTAEMPTHLALDQISKKVIITDWHYGADGEVPTLAHFHEHGFETIACPWNGTGNIRALSRAAYQSKSLGVLMTTWHHLVESMPLLSYVATCLWTEKASGLALPQANNSFPRTATASLLRKLVPAEGSFDRAGWNPWEMPAEKD